MQRAAAFVVLCRQPTRDLCVHRPEDADEGLFERYYHVLQAVRIRTLRGVCGT